MTDGGSIRKKRRPRRQWATNIRIARKTRDYGKTRAPVHPALQAEHGSFYTKFAKKGEPGDDSVNANMPADRSRCRYAAFDRFLLAIDVLVSSGCPVDSIHDDFSAYYEMFALGEFDKWYSAMITSEHGVDQGTQCEFGISHLPDDLNRINFMMCDIITARCRHLMADLDANPSPWSPQLVAACGTFAATRRLIGSPSTGFSQFPWFDDNVAATLRPLTAQVRQIRYDTWAEFHWDVSLPKAAINYWDESKRWEAIVGFEVRFQARVWRLPPGKVDRYCNNIVDLLETAAAHPQNLMPIDDTVEIMGRLAHAAGPVPRIWRHYGALLSLINCQHFEMYVQANPEMAYMFKACAQEMREQRGSPITPYTLRPGADGLRVWQSFTDASRRTDTFYGAGGGWFRLWGSMTVFFFTHRWPAAQVKATNIGVLEMVTESIAADLQQQVQLAAYGTEHVYLLSHGDNSAVSDYVLNSARGTSAAMRRLASLRAARDDDGFRMSSSKHVHREFNRPADHLANEDVPAFITVMASTIPGATFVRLAVDPASASLDDVCDWSHKIALTHALHSRPSTA